MRRGGKEGEGKTGEDGLCFFQLFWPVWVMFSKKSRNFWELSETKLLRGDKAGEEE